MRNAEGETQKTVWTSSPDNCCHQLSLRTLAYITCSEGPSTHDDAVPDTVQEHLTLSRCIPRARNITSNHISCVHCYHTMMTDSKRRKLRFRRTSALIQGRLDWKWRNLTLNTGLKWDIYMSYPTPLYIETPPSLHSGMWIMNTSEADPASHNCSEEGNGKGNNQLPLPCLAS